MRYISLLSNMLIVLLLTGCWPRNHPDRMDRVDVRSENSQICFGNNEYRENLEKYKTVSIGLSRREGLNNEYRYFIDEKFFTKDLMDNDCFSPFALDLFESRVVYGVFMAYGDGMQANWRFTGLFCILDKSADPLEVLQLSGAMDYLSYCS